LVIVPRGSLEMREGGLGDRGRADDVGGQDREGTAGFESGQRRPSHGRRVVDQGTEPAEAPDGVLDDLSCGIGVGR
jgi:hypothetical protein